MQRILVVKLADLGDLLLCEPALRSLRTAFPDADIDVLVPPSTVPLVSLLPHDLTPVPFDKARFDRVTGLLNPFSVRMGIDLARTLRQRRYTAAVFLHHLATPFGARKFAWLARAAGTKVVAGLDNGRGTFLTHRAIDYGFGHVHEAEYMLQVAQAAGGAAVDPRPRFPATAFDESIAMPERFAVIHPTTGPYSPARTWPVERWIDVARGLEAMSLVPVVVGSSDAVDAASAITSAVETAVDLSNATTIPQLASVLQRATCVVGGDSFVGHLAAAVDAPTISVFGPSNVHAWRPFGGSSARHVVMHRLPCQPCVYTGFSLGRPHGCPDRTCLKLIAARDVLRHVEMVCGAG